MIVRLQVFTSAPELPPHVPPVSSFMRYCMAAAQHDPVIAASRFRYVPGRYFEAIDALIPHLVLQ